jgi:hypothetical protein
MRNIEKLQQKITSIEEKMRIKEIGNDSYYLSRDRSNAESRIFELKFEIMFKEKFPKELTKESIPVLEDLKWFSKLYRHTLKMKMCDRALAKVGA